MDSTRHAIRTILLEAKQVRVPHNHIVKAVTAARDEFGSFSSGECGEFAISLNDALGGGGTYLAATLDADGATFDHVALKYGGRIYDDSGLITLSGLKQWANDAAWAWEEEYGERVRTVVVELGDSEDERAMLLSLTNSGACPADGDETTEYLKRVFATLERR